MEKDTEHGTLVPLHPAFQEEQISLDTVGWSSRYGFPICENRAGKGSIYQNYAV